MSKSLKYVASGLMLSVMVVQDETEEVLRTLTISADEVNDMLKNGDTDESVKLYGIRKLLQERSSSEKDTDAKFDTMLETAEILKDGKWKSDEVRTRVPQIDPVFAQAVANVRAKPLAAIVAALQNLSKEARDAMRAHPEVAAEIEKIRTEIAAAGADGDLLGDLA